MLIFRRVLSVVCFLLGNSTASEFYMPTFRNTLFHLRRTMKMEQTECSYTWAYKIQAPENYPEESIQHDTLYVEELLAPCPTPKMENHPLSAVRDCLFSIFTATLHIVGRSSIRNLRTRHAVVTGAYLSRGSEPPRIFNLGRRLCSVVTFTP